MKAPKTTKPVRVRVTETTPEPETIHVQVTETAQGIPVYVVVTSPETTKPKTMRVQVTDTSEEIPVVARFCSHATDIPVALERTDVQFQSPSVAQTASDLELRDCNSVR
jgi:hypothetical protein